MTETKNQRQVRAVFANYKVNTPDGNVGLKSKVRGDTIDIGTLADGELDRLEANGALMPVGGEVPADRIEEVLLRALNPSDVVREVMGEPVSVSPPGMGAAPRGDYTTGDTGIDPADQPAPLPTGTVTAEAIAGDGSLLRTDAPDVEDTAALSKFIKAERLTVPETVALAEGDADRARHVLEAEKAATGQDPRAGVEKGLTQIIEGGAQ